MPNLSIERTNKGTLSKQESLLVYDYKTSDSVDALLTTISEIIAREYVEIARQNPEIFAGK